MISRKVICVLIFVVLLMGCVQRDESPRTSTQSGTPTQVQGSGSQTSSPLPSSTIIPTLSVTDASLLIHDLLSNNGDCRLPCLWGITPGSSKYSEIRNRLISTSSISSDSSFGSEIGDITYEFSEGNLSIFISVTTITYSDSDMIEKIRFSSRALRDRDGGYDSVFDSEIYRDHLAYYLLPQVLSEYGRPEAVLMQTNQPFPPGAVDRGPVYFYILLLYPSQGIYIQYTTDVKLVNENLVGCLENAHVELELIHSGNGDGSWEQLSPSWQVMINEYRPLIEVTSLSLEEFYIMFNQQTSVCLETPADLWARPDE